MSVVSDGSRRPGGALGAVLDLVAGVLGELPGTVVENAPRMADFAKVLAALDTVTGWGTLASYRAKVATLALSLIEGSTFAYAIYRLATAPSPGGLDPGPWEGTAAELLDTLRRLCAEARMPTADLPDDVRVGRPAGPRDRPLAAQGRRRHPGQPDRQTPGPADPQNRRAPAKSPQPSLLMKRKRHVTNVTWPHHRRSADRQGVTWLMSPVVTHVTPPGPLMSFRDVR